MLVFKHRVSNSVAGNKQIPDFHKGNGRVYPYFTQAVAIIAVTRGTYADPGPSDQTAARQWA
jgi:hypothetical protein